MAKKQVDPPAAGGPATPTPRISVKTEGEVPDRHTIADTARLIAESSIDKGALRGIAEQLTRDAKAPISDAARAMMNRWAERSAQLEQIRAAAATPLVLGPRLPNQTARLVDISVRTSEQISQLAELAEATLEQQVQGVLTAAEMRADAKRAATTLTRLTVAIAILTAVIAILTAVLVADALKLGPFT